MTSAPAIANDPLSVSPAPATSVYVKVSPGRSGSLLESEPTVVPATIFSGSVVELSATSTGGLLPLLTEMLTVAADELSAPSLAVNVKLSGPW